ncbi:MAG: hypothetical protein R2798_11525 [Chitinophagales bacterium]|nr:hypothetical protein [Bacteroidota bacterium]MCB9043162.1 hypothetical protein [Chitinophagales bacterium]
MEKDDNFLRNTLIVLLDYWHEIKRKTLWLVPFVIVFLGITYYTKRNDKPTYEAQGSFMSINDDSGGISAFMRLAGQIGFGGGSNKNMYSSELITELIISNKIIAECLLSEIPVGDGKIKLINHYLNFAKVYTSFPEKPELENVRITHTDLDKMSLEENTLLQESIQQIRKEALNVNASESGIVSVQCITSDEVFSKYFIENLMQTLSRFYSDKAVSSQYETFHILSERVDSINSALFSAEYKISRWYDEKQPKIRAASVSADEYTQKLRLERDVEFASAVLAEAIKNRELARMNVESQKPVIQVIDSPAFPLKKNLPRRIVPYIIAFLAACFIGSLLIVLRKIIRDAMQDV